LNLYAARLAPAIAQLPPTSFSARVSVLACSRARPSPAISRSSPTKTEAARAAPGEKRLDNASVAPRRAKPRYISTGDVDAFNDVGLVTGTRSIPSHSRWSHRWPAIEPAGQWSAYVVARLVTARRSVLGMSSNCRERTTTIAPCSPPRALKQESCHRRRRSATAKYDS